jgi:hypothetical protein
MHTGGEGGRGGSTLPKDSGKLYHKNAIKHEKEDPLPDFLITPSTPSKEFENDCASLHKREST